MSTELATGRRGDLLMLGSQVQVALAVLTVPVGILALIFTLSATVMLSYYLIFGSVLVVGGVALLVCAYRPLRLSGWQWVILAAAGVVGTAVSLLLRWEDSGGSFLYNIHAGYPFDFIVWTSAFDTNVTSEVARRLMDENPRLVRMTFEPAALLADAAFWAYAGLIVLLPIRQVLRALRRKPSTAPSDGGEPLPA